MIKQTAELDGPNVIQWVEQEPGSGGKESAENTIRSLAGLPIFRETVTGAKEVRAEPYSAQVEGENVALLSGGTWQQEYIAELRMFPNGKFSDQVDASSGAFNKLALPEKKKQVGMW
jgi:predicted phage terminase large subunit-like protein